MNNTKTLVNILDKSIDELKEKREYFKNEKSDFTRKRKLNFEKIINLLMCMESGSLKDELYNYFDLNINNPTSSALIQQRNKIKPEAFELMKYVHSLSIDEERIVSEGLSLFCKYFRNLWD